MCKYTYKYTPALLFTFAEHINDDVAEFCIESARGKIYTSRRATSFRTGWDESAISSPSVSCEHRKIRKHTGRSVVAEI